jgi:hypothetical protein
MLLSTEGDALSSFTENSPLAWALCAPRFRHRDAIRTGVHSTWSKEPALLLGFPSHDRRAMGYVHNVGQSAPALESLLPRHYDFRHARLDNFSAEIMATESRPINESVPRQVAPYAAKSGQY